MVEAWSVQEPARDMKTYQTYKDRGSFVSGADPTPSSGVATNKMLMMRVGFEFSGSRKGQTCRGRGTRVRLQSGSPALYLLGIKIIKPQGASSSRGFIAFSTPSGTLTLTLLYTYTYIDE